jgi:pimeloyl-ACP methyl ester carboxylesterase
MDRRGHGASAEGTNYSIRKEAEDIVAVINSQHGKVNLVGHSYGAICSFEAAFLTSKISKLVLYEPPFMQTIDPAIPTKMESLISKNQREDALVLFLTEVVKVPPQEIAAARKSPTWANRVAAIHNSVRETRALNDYKFDAARAAKLRLPTLLLTGSETARHHTESINTLARALPDQRTYVFKGQGHNAIDTVPEEFVKVVSTFVAG